MGVRITSMEDKVALFDSGSDFAFGPVFDSEIDAQEFLQWLHATDGRDARSLEDKEIESLQYKWEQEAHPERFEVA